VLSSRSSQPMWDCEGPDECNWTAAARWSRAVPRDHLSGNCWDPRLVSLRLGFSRTFGRGCLGGQSKSTLCPRMTALKRIRLGSWRHCETH
jgi:hypothetical protein